MSEISMAYFIIIIESNKRLLLRSNHGIITATVPPEVRVTSGQNICTEIMYIIVVHTSVEMF